MTDKKVIEFLERKAKRAHPCDAEYYDRAISALQEREERSKGCAHCIDLFGSDLSREPGRNFCKNCGRKLKPAMPGEEA